MKERKVKIIHLNADLKPVGETEYDLADYTQMMRLDLLKVITEVEELVYSLLDGKRKTEWPEDVRVDFDRIKHRLLDKAGDIGRLPDTMIEVEDAKKADPLGDFIASVFGSGKEKE